MFLFHILSCMLLFLSFQNTLPRSPLRKKEPNAPFITIGWANDPDHFYTQYNSHYEEHPVFTVFNDAQFTDYLLPEGPLSTKENESSLTGTQLSKLIEELLVDIRKRKKKFKHFTVLQNRNFNSKRQCGLIVLKCKKHPFVVKLFLETPKSFINPYCKGIDSIAFFYMSGGTNRHMTGFTRINNLHRIKTRLSNNPDFFKLQCVFPRKWFWTPADKPWITIKGYNIGKQQTVSTTFPGTYAIIADYIDTKEVYPLEHKQRNAFIMNFCNKLDVAIDPHANNFIIDKDPANQDSICVKIIDTEFFPSLVGLRQKKQFRNYNSWYQYLTGKCIGDMYFRPKSTRIYAQKKMILHNS